MKQKERLNQALVENWNLKHPVGTKVTVTKDDGTVIDSETTSEAQVLGGHTPVIWLEGIRGCYALDRVRAKADANE